MTPRTSRQISGRARAGRTKLSNLGANMSDHSRSFAANKAIMRRFSIATAQKKNRGRDHPPPSRSLARGVPGLWGPRPAVSFATHFGVRVATQGCLGPRPGNNPGSGTSSGQNIRAETSPAIQEALGYQGRRTDTRTDQDTLYGGPTNSHQDQPPLRHHRVWSRTRCVYGMKFMRWLSIRKIQNI